MFFPNQPTPAAIPTWTAEFVIVFSSLFCWDIFYKYLRILMHIKCWLSFGIGRFRNLLRPDVYFSFRHLRHVFVSSKQIKNWPIPARANTLLKEISGIQIKSMAVDLSFSSFLFSWELLLLFVVFCKFLTSSNFFCIFLRFDLFSIFVGILVIYSTFWFSLDILFNRNIPFWISPFKIDSN